MAETEQVGRGPDQRLRIAVALLTVALVVAALIHGQGTEEKLLGASMFAALGVITVTDVESRRIPNLVTGPAALAALAIGAATYSGKLTEQLLAAAVTGAALLLVAIFARGGLGMGDVKLGAMLGCFLGRGVADALMVGFALAALVGIVTIARVGLARGRRMKMFLGPYLAIGAAVAFFLVTPFVQFT